MRLRLLPLALLLAASPLAAQQKKPLTQASYDYWRTITGATLSPDGAHVAWTQTPVVGDGQVHVAPTAGGGRHLVIERGWTGRPQLQPNADSGWTAPPAQWSADSRWLAFLAYAPQAQFDEARRLKRRPNQMPKATLVLQDVATAGAAPVRIADVKTFRMPREGRGQWIAYHLEADSAARPAAGAQVAPRDTTARPAGAPQAPTTAVATPGGTPRPVGDSTGTPAARRETGTTLVLRDLASGTEVRIADVAAYSFSDSGRWLGYTVAARDRAKDGAYVRELASGREIALLTGSGKYAGLAFDRAERQVAFVSDKDVQVGGKPAGALWHAALPAGKAQQVAAPATLGDGRRVSERGVQFTRDGSAVTFGVAEAPLDSIPADSLADKAIVDLWHWKDTRLQPQQRLEATRDRDRAYTAIWRPDTRKVVRLASDSIPNAQVSDNGEWALVSTNLPYAVSQMWGEGGTDAYVVNVRTGARTQVGKRMEFPTQLSPAGRYVTWFDSGYHARDVRTGAVVDMTKGAPGVRFEQETWDTPGTPAPWGIAGWTEGDRSLLAYSRYDVWELDPTGKRAPRVVTDSLGVRRHMTLRVVDLDPDGRYVEPELLLSAFDDSTKASGFWRDRIDANAAPTQVVMADVRFGRPEKARKAGTFLVTRQTVKDFPDLYVGPSLDRVAKVSDANPQQAEHEWATVELVSWTSADGRPLQGLLYKPDDYDASKKYPLMVYFYESLSDNLHQYNAPSGRNVINPIVYASKGYVVFFPDIAYTEGYPGQSAMLSIIPGIQMLVAKGVVDQAKIGVAGQSWGGYQAAYMITQTPLFRAAMLGAPVANMTSAYGGIRWESGVARAFQYERGQSRIGGDPWRYPMRYIENSPLFQADRIRTPVLIMSNDADGAVPWYQGIEMFVALRRLNKEVYLLNYNGDGHNPRKRANQKDVDMRMQQFFDHHLLGAPAPEWMEKGIPFLQKGRDQLASPRIAEEAGQPAKKVAGNQ
jgi:dipeptidyl aminopeptidase/acylaminoacyl peptidase